jgi:glycine/D-amino acid oxidase-like deaminating enzyme
LRVPGDAICYPPAIVRTLLGRATALGATIVKATVQALRPGAAQYDDGRWVEAGVVVVAAGPQSAVLVPDLPVIPRRGHLVITERAPRRIHHQLVELGYLHSAHTLGGASVAFNVQPRVTGQLLVGSSRELVGFAPGLNRDLLAMMLARASALVPSLADMRVLRTWTGFRPATPDALPLIGAWPAMDRTWIATGHEGLGITLAPATADLIVAGLLGEEPPVAASAFAPDRRMPSGAAA